MLDRRAFAKSYYKKKSQKDFVDSLAHLLITRDLWNKSVTAEWAPEERLAYHWMTTWLDDAWMSDPEDVIKLHGYLLGDYAKFACNKKGMLAVLCVLYSLDCESYDTLCDREIKILDGIVGFHSRFRRDMNICVIDGHDLLNRGVGTKFKYMLNFVDSQTIAKVLSVQKPGSEEIRETLLSYIKEHTIPNYEKIPEC